MSTQAAYPIPKLDRRAFELQLAGIEDVEASGAFSPSDFRNAASDFACALAVVFNRRELKVTSLWDRIGSAIESSVGEAQGGDIGRFETFTLRHVKASVAVVAASEVYHRLTEPLRAYTEDEEAAVAFVRYLNQHIYSVAIFGRKKWENRKEEMEAERERLEAIEQEQEEGGEE